MERTIDQPMPPFPIDVEDPRLYDDPWEAYRWLRDEAPVWHDALNDLYVISRHEDVVEVSRDAARYSAAEGVRPKVPVDMGLISSDDPEHTRLRRLVNRGFTPRMVRAMSDHIREVTVGIIDDIEARGTIDFVEDFAIHVPLIVIAEMLGLDPDDRMRLYRWSDAMMAGDGHIDLDDPVMLAAGEAFGEYVTLCQTLIEQRRDQPREDIISILTQAADDGALDSGEVDKLEDDELLMFLALLVVAGNETTRNAISGGLVAFSRFPDQRQRLIDDPSLIDLAVDEIVRWLSPVLSFIRTVTEDHELRGVPLKAGDRVFMLYQSANRDPRVFDDPDAFFVDRDPNPHVAFGIGTHYCLGANLARAEIKIVFEELFRRLHEIRVAEPDAPLERGNSSLVMAIQHLPAVLSPDEATARA